MPTVRQCNDSVHPCSVASIGCARVRPWNRICRGPRGNHHAAVVVRSKCMPGRGNPSADRGGSARPHAGAGARLVRTAQVLELLCVCCTGPPAPRGGVLVRGQRAGIAGLRGIIVELSRYQDLSRLNQEPGHGGTREGRERKRQQREHGGSGGQGETPREEGPQKGARLFRPQGLEHPECPGEQHAPGQRARIHGEKAWSIAIVS